jgi:hypothetical protein
MTAANLDCNTLISNARFTFKGKKETCLSLARSERARAAGIECDDIHISRYRDGVLLQARRYEEQARVWELHEQVAAEGLLLKLSNTPPNLDGSIGGLGAAYAAAAAESRIKFLTKHEALDMYPHSTVDPRGVSRATVQRATGEAVPRPEGYPSAQPWQSPERMR